MVDTGPLGASSITRDRPLPEKLRKSGVSTNIAGSISKRPQSRGKGWKLFLLKFLRRPPDRLVLFYDIIAVTSLFRAFLKGFWQLVFHLEC